LIEAGDEIETPFTDQTEGGIITRPIMLVLETPEDEIFDVVDLMSAPGG
jgi:hypothetical protein